jgi:hypothetical protein
VIYSVLGQERNPATFTERRIYGDTLFQTVCADMNINGVRDNFLAEMARWWKEDVTKCLSKHNLT